MSDTTTPARRSANYAQVHRNLHATSLTPEFHERTCGYWFTVTSGAMAHTAFATRAGLDRWLAERGLALEHDIPDYSDPAVIPSRENWREGTTRITGEYRTVTHGEHSPTEESPYRMTEGDWPPANPVLATSTLSNGKYTLALITEDDDIRTVHTLNCNVKTRVIDHVPGQGWEAYIEGEHKHTRTRRGKTMELIIQLKLDSAAMTENEEGLVPDGRAVAVKLRELARQFEDGIPVGTSRRILDANGNTIGQWTTITD